MNNAKPYFAHPLPHLLAHRGLHQDVIENTLDAFAAAIEAGATHIETDVHATADKVAVLHHDGEFLSAGELIQVDKVSLDQLRHRAANAGFSVPTLTEALDRFPDAFFNIDIKSDSAVGPFIAAISSTQSANRVLVASFNAKRRHAVVAALPGIASSASRREVLWSWIASSLGFSRLARRILRGVDAVQVPAVVGPLPLVTKRYIRFFHQAGIFVHVWTINDPAEMLSLANLGVDGIVTDRVDLAFDVLADFES